MTNDNKEFLKEFMLGVSVVIGGLAVFILFIAIIGTPESPQDEVGSPKFKVIDQYNKCDIVRYIDPLL